MSKQDSNIIPLVDLDEPTESEVRGQAVAQAAKVLATDSSFVLTSVQGEQLNVVAACTSEELFQMTIALMTMVGAERVGESLQNVPPGVVHAITLASGLKALSAYVNHVAGQSGRPPATPASDILSPTIN